MSINLKAGRKEETNQGPNQGRNQGRTELELGAGAVMRAVYDMSVYCGRHNKDNNNNDDDDVYKAYNKKRMRLVAMWKCSVARTNGIEPKHRARVYYTPI